MTSRRLPAALGAAGLGATAAIMHDVGHRILRAPPLDSWADASAWYADVGPAVAVVTLLRIATVVGCTWLCAATVLQLVASVPGGRFLRRAADLVSPQALRRVGHGMAGLSLTAGLALPSAAAQVSPSPTDPPGGLATMTPLDAARSDAGPGDTPGPGHAPSPVPATDALTAMPDEHEVVAGESFWRIAEDVVEDALGRPPDEGEVRAYWLRLMAANADRLVVPGVADLIFPGQRFVLPPS